MFEAIQKETFITTQATAKPAYQACSLNQSYSSTELKLFDDIDGQSDFNDRYRPRAN